MNANRASHGEKAHDGTVRPTMMILGGNNPRWPDTRAGSTAEVASLPPDRRQGVVARATPGVVTSAVRGVWVAQQHAVVRRGMVSALLGEQITVVGEGPSLDPPPDLANTAVLIFDADGLGFAQAIAAARGRPIRLVATLRVPTGSRLSELAAAGVCAILLLDELTPESLVRTTWLVAHGDTTLSHTLLMRLIDHAARVSADATGALSVRERQVLQMLAEGQDTRSIAAELNYSERTIKNIVHDLLVKLNCRTRAQAVGMAAKAGVI